MMNTATRNAQSHLSTLCRLVNVRCKWRYAAMYIIIIIIIMVEPYEEVVGNPHYTSISLPPSPVVEEDRSVAETFK